MSGDGRKALLGILILPLFAALGALILFGDSDILGNTLMFVFGTNLIPMLIGGLFSGLLIRSFNKSGGSPASRRWVALAPVLLPFVFGVVWYLMSILNQGAADAGREYFAGPFYLLGLALGAGIIASIVYMVMPKASARAEK